MKMKRFLAAQRGFTLIEMLIVLLIIGIIVAVALPDFQKAAAEAQDKVCQANAKTLEMQLLQYHFEKNQFPPPVQDLDGVLDDTAVIALLQWFLDEGYIRDDGTFKPEQFRYEVVLDSAKGKATIRCLLRTIDEEAT